MFLLSFCQAILTYNRHKFTVQFLSLILCTLVDLYRQAQDDPLLHFPLILLTYLSFQPRLHLIIPLLSPGKKQQI